MMDGSVTLGRGHVFPLDNYKKGARVWHRHPELVWIGGELDHDITFAATNVRVTLENGESVVLTIKKEEDLPFLRNPAILIGKDDLTSLSYLHEPAVLHNLNFRFVEREAIYTYCGIVLVAINPYANCQHLYGEDVIQVYRGVGKSVRDLDPHIYAVAEEAFFDLYEFGKCQSIIVSGESGAGKTVSAKFVMRYLASIASSRQGAIEDKVLASNPIMEAIGNAKTIRNDNSSRFGKFIQINFGDNYAIAGAEMKTYLLEKSRLVFQANNERNYHIFYQMCKSRDHKLLKDFHLGPSESFWYTSQGGDSRIPGVDDRADFEETVKALDVLNFSENSQFDMMKVLAGILQLGNIQFADGDDSTSVLPHCANDLRRLCQDMYSIHERELEMWLTVREIRAAGEVVRKPLSCTEATRSRDALAKLIYAQLFNWIVHQINSELANKDSASIRRRQEKFIGVLDIYGFETFDINSFEQFCINYANEKLQQQFNQHVFKLEQEEYVREEIAWVRIDFHDNQPAIDLIEGRPGLIDYLDEQCKVVKGSDAGWLNQMTACPTLKKNPQLEMPRIRSQKFIVKHFAADVPYTIDGFMEKNKDSVSEQLLEVIGKSKFPFLLQVLGPNMIPDNNNTGGKRPVKKTVASQFRDSLRELMGVLGQTRPHYVRCIKPNDSKERFYFEPKRAIQQLRACGVLETVRLSAAGFPSRWTYDEFGRRYRVLYPEGKAMWRDRPRQFAEKACAKTLEADKFALGKTKIFFRTGQVAVLERVRLETLSISATLIQAKWRGFVARRKYVQMQESIRTIQAATRAFLVYRRIKFLQMHRAAVLIQSCIRGYFERRRYQATRSAVIAIQSRFRGAIVRRMVEKLRYEQSAIIIQKYFRGYLVRREEIKRRKKIVLVQACVRRWLAKRRLRELKIEARSVGHLQKLNSGLENKIIELQMKLDVVSSDRNKLTVKCSELDKLRIHVHELEAERTILLGNRKKMDDLKLEVERLQTECDIKDAQKAGVENLNKGLKSQLETLKIDSTRKNAALSEELTTMSARVKELERENKKMQTTITHESDARHKAENEVSLMREQLLQNANLLASPGFSRTGSMRQNENSLDSVGKELNSLGSYSGDVDEIALILQQQKSINEMRSRTEHYQRENDRLRGLMEASQLVDSMDKRTSLRAFESHRLQELETSYGRLKLEVERLIAEKADHGLENMNVKLVLDRLLEDNERCREESAELRAMLSNRFERQSGHTASPQPADSGTWSENHSEDGSGHSDLEEELCLERQCRQLKALAENLSRSLTDRNREIEKLEKRINETVQPFRPSDCSVEESLRAVHGQLNHLASENISLNDKLSKHSEDLAEARAQLRGYTGGLGFALDTTSDSEIVRLETLSKEGVEHSALLEVFNVPEFTRILICDLKPRLARLLTKCFPAYLLLTAFRYHDKEKDETKLTGLFNTLHVLLKDTISRSVDMDVLSVWLVNSWRLLNLLRQYSGDSQDANDQAREWHAANTPKQNLHRVQNYGMGSIREQLKSRVEESYQYLMKKAIEPVLSPKIVPGILQHDSTSHLSNGKEQLSRKGSKDTPRKGLDDLLDFLNFIHAKLSVYGADQILLSQVFGQMTHWICALALNHLMFRRDLCTFEKAIQINYNVMQLENWLHSKGFGGFKDALQPLRQACHLLQCPKDESNIDTLLEVTDRLKPKQVIEILRHYTPGQDFSESPIEPEFLELVLRSLHERETAKGASEDDQNSLIMRGTYLIPFDSKQFVYSDFPLESLSLPSCLHLQQVCRLH